MAGIPLLQFFHTSLLLVPRSEVVLWVFIASGLEEGGGRRRMENGGRGRREEGGRRREEGGGIFVLRLLNVSITVGREVVLL